MIFLILILTSVLVLYPLIKLCSMFVNFSLSLIFGILTILFIFWNRFLRVHLTKQILVSSLLTWDDYVVLLLAIGFSFIAFYYVLLLYKYLPKDNSKLTIYLESFLQHLSHYKWFESLYIIITIDLPNGPRTLYNYLYIHINIQDFINKLGTLLHNFLFDNVFRIRLVYIISFILPKVTVALSFLMDIIYYYKQLDYFYKTLILLIIPLFVNFLFFMIKDHAIRHLEGYNYFFIFDLNKNTKVLSITCKPLIKIEDINLQNAYLAKIDNLQNNWYFYQYLYNISYQMLNYRVYMYKYHVNIVYYTIFSIGFLFYFLILLGLW